MNTSPMQTQIRTISRRRANCSEGQRNDITYTCMDVTAIEQLLEEYKMNYYQSGAYGLLIPDTIDNTTGQPKYGWEFSAMNVMVKKAYIKLQMKNNGSTPLKIQWWPWWCRRDTNLAAVSPVEESTKHYFNTSSPTSFINQPEVPYAQCLKKITPWRRYGKPKFIGLQPGEERTIYVKQGPRSINLQTFTDRWDKTNQNTSSFKGWTFGGNLLFHGCIGSAQTDDLEGNNKASWMDGTLNIIETHHFKYCYKYPREWSYNRWSSSVGVPATDLETQLKDTPKKETTPF